ncbi:hypothetical protein LJB42_001342 [Komagataella kurtzmanii]|nr:hypothetical protein LJB42_001342 [Komagataella kurtzmanii]
MELQVAPRDADILLKDKNILNNEVLEKYTLAGKIAQSCLTYLVKLINEGYHTQVGTVYSINELCALGDSYLINTINGLTETSSVIREKGIAQPVCIEANDVVSGYSPELDETANVYLQPGDIATITLGCHLDGYTANFSHTVVIFPPGQSPTGPLLTGKADAVCAAHIATETITTLLAATTTPEKIPAAFGNKIIGSTIRSVVDSIAQSFNCRVLPGSRVRRVRRFLAGQAEGLVAEKEYKGVVWSESDQEKAFLESVNSSQDLTVVHKLSPLVKNLSTVPTDEFQVLPGEAYIVDIRMASLEGINEVGYVTLQSVDQIVGKNKEKSSITSKPSLFLRDVIMVRHLKLKASRTLLDTVDKKLSVFPFKLAHTASSYPINISNDGTAEPVETQLSNILNEMKRGRLGMSEITNRRLCVTKPIQTARFIPLKVVLEASNATGLDGYDAANPTLPGLETPLPRLGISSLKLKSLLKKSIPIDVARECSTILLPEQQPPIRLTGGSTSKPSYVHSNYELDGPYKQAIYELVKLTEDSKFGLSIQECPPF